MAETTAATSTPEIKTTQFTAKQMVEFGGQAPSDALLVTLQGLRETDGGKKAMEEYRLGNKEGQKLSQEDLGKLKEIAADENKVVAETISKQLESVNIYCEVAARIQAEGGQPSRILTELKVDRSWTEIKTQALDILADTKVVRSIYKGIDKNQRIRIIEEKIASDPRFREAFAQGAKEALARIDSLPKVNEPEGKKLKEDERDELKDKTDRHFESLKTITGLEDRELRELFDQDLGKEAVLEQLLQQSLEKKGVQGEDIPKFKAVLEQEVKIKTTEAEVVQIEDQINSLQDELAAAKSIKAKKGKGEENRQEEIRELEKRIKAEESKKTRKQTELDRLKNELTSLPNDLKVKLNTYRDLYKRIYGKEPSITEEEPKATAAVPNHVQKLIEQLPQLKQKIKEIKALESADKDYQKQLSQRELAEADIIKQLETVFNDSIVDLFDKRFDEMTELDKKRLVKEQDEGLKKFDEWLEKRYVEFDTNKRREIHHRVTTGEDMRLVAWYGNDGVKRIAAKHLGYDTNPSTWTDEQKINIDKIFDKKGQDIRKKLFTSYFKERTFVDKSFRLRNPFNKEFLFDGGIGDLTLTDAEWGRLGEHFGSEIEAGLSSSKEAQSVLNGLKEKGINPNWNLKWLLYILIALGIIGGIAFVATR